VFLSLHISVLLQHSNCVYLNHFST